MKGVRTTESSSLAKIMIFMSNSSPNSFCTYAPETSSQGIANKKVWCVYLLRMELAFPLCRHVVRVVDDIHHEDLWVEHEVLLGYHTPRRSKDTTEYCQIKQHGSMGRDLEVENQLWFNN